MRWAEGGRSGGRERRTLGVCVHRGVSGVSRGGQGNKSEQRGVMRVGWSAAVINTMLGSTRGHTFGSGKNKPTFNLSLWTISLKTVLNSFLFFSLAYIYGMPHWFCSFCACIFIQLPLIPLPFLTCIFLHSLLSLVPPECLHSSPTSPLPPLSLPLPLQIPPFLFTPLSASRLPLALFLSLTDTDVFLRLCVCVCAPRVCPDTAVPCPTSAVKHLVNYTAGQREGGWRERGKDAERGKKEEEEEDRSSLLTLLAFLTETNVTNV